MIKSLQISEPTLLLNKDVCRQNILQMVQKANEQGKVLRPHFKTHQSASVGMWFREAGINRIAVSSLKMACYFAENGWNDITIAFPLYPHQIKGIDALSAHCNLNVVVEDVEVAEFYCEHLQNSVGVYIKIDTGYGRTGIQANNFETIDRLLAVMHASKLIFKGFLAHAGHTYKVVGATQIEAIKNDSLEKLKVLRNHYLPNYRHLHISFGDTPSCSVCDQFEGVDELRPGNFVFYDLTQTHIGSCNISQIAVALAAPVVTVHPQKGVAIVHGGAVHLSKDYLTANGTPYYGMAYLLKDNGWDLGCQVGKVIALSQEHGTVELGDNGYGIKAGDTLAILPIHSCLTANLMGRYLTLDGELIEMMER